MYFDSLNRNLKSEKLHNPPILSKSKTEMDKTSERSDEISGR